MLGRTSENQFFISSTYGSDPVKNQIAAALVERILMAARSGVKFKVTFTSTSSWDHH